MYRPERIADILDDMADKIRDGRYRLRDIAIIPASPVGPQDCTMSITYTDRERILDARQPKGAE